MYFNENYKYEENFDETKFIIGLDIGNSDTALSFFDFNTNKVEQLDISGGYGKASVPTVVQYINDTGEWVFGEYALMNKPLSDSITFDNLILKLGKKNSYTVGKNVFTHSFILSLFIKEVIGNIKNINPNAEIIGISVSVPYLSEDGEEEFLRAFSEAGYYDKLIGFFSEKECILNKYCFEEEKIPSKIITLDFGSREIRCGFYNIFESENEIAVNIVSAFGEKNISTSIIEKKVYDIFEGYFKENTKESNISKFHKLQLEAFVYQYKNLIFKSKKGIKLYFNFVYPPFQKTIEKYDIENITLEFKGSFYKFLEDIFEKMEDDNSGKMGFNIDKVICCGGGFEMNWIKQVVVDIFGESRSVIYKNPKNILSYGACLIAAKYFNVIKSKKIIFSENITLTQDIGLIFCDKDNGSKFIPFIEKNSFWRQKFKSKSVIINEIDEPPCLNVFKKDKDGNLIIVGRIILDDLPKRPKGTNCFDILFEFIEYNKLNIKIKDMGFGDFFKKTDYERNVIIDI